jgi:hypothetical protein|tara:strand:+ start:26611 stop:26937 length:327 start_codon:yes stop_codon:yes gene_type:complete
MNKLKQSLRKLFEKIKIPSSFIKIDYYRTFYVIFFLVVYISNQHSVERKVREINRLEKEVEELGTDYVTLKNNYMFSRKETEVLKRVKKLNLNISKKPPEKISIKDEY